MTRLLTRLLELGHKETDFPSYDPEWDRYVRRPRDLTPRSKSVSMLASVYSLTAIGWTLLRPKLEACIQRAKEQRKDAEWQARLATRKVEMTTYILGLLTRRQDRDKQLYMHLWDALKLPTVEAMLSEDCDDWQITEQRWNAARDQIEKEMDEFSDAYKTRLMQGVIACKAMASSSGHLDCDTTQPSNLPKVNTDILLSPSTFFKCVRCGFSSQYPSLLQHSHCSFMSAEDFTFHLATTSLAETLYASIQTRGDYRNNETFLGSEFQCLRCDENVSIPLDWGSLVGYLNQFVLLPLIDI